MISRPLDPGEAFFFMQDLVSCMNFVVFAERSTPLEPERLHNALQILQAENGLLQTCITWTEAGGMRFEPAPDLPIELQQHHTRADNWQSWIEQELSSPFATGSAPLMRCLYLDIVPPDNGMDEQGQTPVRSVLALTFHHAIADGRSGTDLLRRLLTLMASHAAPAHTTPKVLPSMLDLMPPHTRWAEQPDAAKQLRTTLITDYRRHGVLPALPWLATEASTRTPKLIRLHLTPEVTQRLITEARAHATTVHGLLCAAQLLAQFKLMRATEPTAFFLSCPVDMRPHLEPAPPVTPTGLFVSLISATFQISIETEAAALARDIISQTRLQLARGEGHLLYHLYGLDGSPVPPAALELFRKKSMASLPNTMISNVGPIAPVTNDPDVQAISFALCPMPYQSLFTAASTYQGRLILNVGYDAARLTDANAHALAQGIQDVLLALSSPSTGMGSQVPT